jgi:hypothetical protein
MKLTNKLGLPQPIVKAVSNDGYNSGDCDISVTSLLKPPQMKALENLFEEQLEEDVSDRIWSLLGQVVHGILERAEETAIAEERLYIDVNGWRVGGQMDRFLLKEGILQDYKFTSVYKIRDGVPEEYAKQLNIYAHILRKNGKNVNKLQIVAILRDWSKNQYMREGDPYPAQQVVLLDVPIIPDEEVAAYVEERVSLHKAAASLSPHELADQTPCSSEDRWARGDVWAIIKKGQKKATRLCQSEDAAKLALESLGTGYSIKFRPGENVRCRSYCSAARFCEQYKKLESQNKGDDDED